MGNWGVSLLIDFRFLGFSFTVETLKVTNGF
jgi:hypothetical protein